MTYSPSPTVKCPVLGYKDETCEIAAQLPDSRVVIYELPEEVYQKVKLLKFVDVVIPKEEIN